jgi:choline kinase
MISVILAAGISSRLRPLTNNTPKCLLSVGGFPLLERTLRSLERSGVDECVLVTGYFHEKVEQFAGTLDLATEIHFIFNPHFASTNNNYSLWMAGQAAAGQDMLLLDADILFDRRLIPLLLGTRHENALIIRPSGNLGHEEIKLESDASGRILHIGKEIDPVHAIGESVGIEKFGASTTSRLFEILERRKERNEFYEASFQEMIDEGSAVYTVDCGSYGCVEIDTPDDLVAAEHLAPTLAL